MVDNVRGWREGNGKWGKRTNARTWLLEIGESGREQWVLVIIEESTTVNWQCKYALITLVSIALSYFLSVVPYLLKGCVLVCLLLALWARSTPLLFLSPFHFSSPHFLLIRFSLQITKPSLFFFFIRLRILI